MVPMQTLPYHIFGPSMFFGKDIGNMLPSYLQPILFYPDWFFMAYPHYAAMNILCHGRYYFTNGTCSAFIIAILYWLIGIYCLAGGVMSSINDDVDTFFAPIFQIDMGCSLLLEIVQVPLIIINAIWFLIYYGIAALLYWHIVVAEFLDAIFTLCGNIGWKLTPIIRKIVFFCMLAPAIVVLFLTCAQLIYIVISPHFSATPIIPLPLKIS
jgi:hypothetical protein